MLAVRTDRVRHFLGRPWWFCKSARNEEGWLRAGFPVAERDGDLARHLQITAEFRLLFKALPRERRRRGIRKLGRKKGENKQKKKVRDGQAERVSLVRQINVQSGSGSDDVSTTIGGDGTMRDNGTWSLNQDNALCTLHLAKSEWINGYNG